MNENTQEGMRPIWYFVGWVLFLSGLIVVIAGVYGIFYTLPSTSVIGYLHPNLWWGGLMTIVGLIYMLKNRKIRIQ